MVLVIAGKIFKNFEILFFEKIFFFERILFVSSDLIFANFEAKRNEWKGEG